VSLKTWPLGDVAVGGQDDRAVLVAARDDLEEVAGGLVGQRQVLRRLELRPVCLVCGSRISVG
jgi:hypothetical protein